MANRIGQADRGDGTHLPFAFLGRKDVEQRAIRADRFQQSGDGAQPLG